MKKLIHKIETGEQWEVVEYYKLLHEDLNLLGKEDIELIVLYMLDILTKLTKDQDQIHHYVEQKLFSTFATHLITEPTEKDFLNLAYKIVCGHCSQTPYNTIYLEAYDQMVNSVEAEREDKIREYVSKRASSLVNEKFYTDYDDGDFLPF